MADPNEAASVLGKAALDRDQLLVLAQALRAAGPSELPKLVLPFATSTDEVVGSSLIENLKMAKSVSSLEPAILPARDSKIPRDRSGAGRGTFCHAGRGHSQTERASAAING